MIVFIGYPKETMGYYFYQPSNHKVFVARGATFLEREFLVEGNYGKEIELDETQVTNDNITQEHEMETERPFFFEIRTKLFNSNDYGSRTSYCSRTSCCLRRS